MRVVDDDAATRTGDHANVVGEPADDSQGERGAAEAADDDRTPEEEGYGYGV